VIFRFPSLRRIAKPNPGAFRMGIVLLFAMLGSARSQAFLEPEEAGADFVIQGEYGGKTAAESSLGAQVVALGGGAFTAVFLPGGLPGQGADGKLRVEAAGVLAADGKAGFSGGGYAATASADGTTLSGKTDKGESFTLGKIMRKSPTEGAAPPSGAIVLFDGNGVEAWMDGSASMDARKLFKPVGTSASSGAVTKRTFQNFTMHLEFRLPFMPAASGQRRGNSGIYLQGRDELQVLDSFGIPLDGGTDSMAAKRECGAFFEYFRPTLNAAYPPLSWQTYDLEFTAAQYDAAGKTKLQPARATVRWNGIKVHSDIALANSTLLGDAQGPLPGPQRFQAYGDPVFYRNIWVLDGVAGIRERDGYPGNRKAGSGSVPGPNIGKSGAAAFADGRAASSATVHTGKISYSRSNR
jgi:3-keto-disaccharide hydrolase